MVDSASRWALSARSSISAIATPFPSWIAPGQSQKRLRYRPFSFVSPNAPSSISHVQPPSHLPFVGRAFTLQGQPQSQLHATSTRPLIVHFVAIACAITLLRSHVHRHHKLRTEQDNACAKNEGYAHRAAEPDRARNELLHQNDQRDQRDPREAHPAGRDEHGHKRPAASQAVQAVIDAQAQRTERAAAPVAHEEVGWCLACAKARRLERRELVCTRRNEDRGDAEWAQIGTQDRIENALRYEH